MSTDELGDLAFALNSVLGKLRQIPRDAERLGLAAGGGGQGAARANNEQQQSLTRQAAAIQRGAGDVGGDQAHLADGAERAESVLHVAKRAEELGQRGRGRRRAVLQGLGAIRRFVDAMQVRLNRLAESTTQMGEITEAVKDLADQSNLLAVNAAIEAARAGEQRQGLRRGGP